MVARAGETMNFFKYSKRELGWVALIIVLLIPLSDMFLLRSFPVLWKFQAVTGPVLIHTQGGTVVEAEIVGRKLDVFGLRHCEFLGISGHYKYRDANIRGWSEAGFAFVNDESPNSDHPAGYHDFGKWRWIIPSGASPTEVQAVTSHSCNGFLVDYPVYTTVGPFAILL
jgi:hypothetical protein